MNNRTLEKMEDFKILNFQSKSQGEVFPWFRSLNKSELERIAEKISLLMNEDVKGDLLELVMKVVERAAILPRFNAEDEGFALSSVLKELNIIPMEKVYVNWYRFDNIDEIRFQDLNNYFSDIWYPGPDDIDIFDESLSWILSISHNGEVLINDLRGG